jgi:hypothetical protein
MSTVTPLVIRLQQLLRDDDMEAVECVNTLKNCLGNAVEQHEFKLIETAINHYDFERALDVLDNVAQHLAITLEP